MEHVPEREAMVRRQIEARGVRDPRVLAAMRAVPRHRFAPAALASLAYADAPLPLVRGATLSQPYIVAFAAEALRLEGSERVLEIGSGSGYLAAVLDRLAGEVHGLELDPGLAAASAALLAELGCAVEIHAGDGRLGLPRLAPFDAIVLSCAAEETPPALLAQLAEGGRMVLPLARPRGPQQLVRITRRNGRLSEEPLLDVAFVPLR